ncbi:hypothetical protein L2744_00450 [Shewanella profunda]|nr:hypothetical protein [Shewanella profunda]
MFCSVYANSAAQHLKFSVGADYRLFTKTMVYGHDTRFDGDLMLSDAKQDLDDIVFTVGLRVDF